MPNQDTTRQRLLNMVMIAGTLALCIFFLANNGRKKNFYGDALGYYLYLPCTFIYHTLDIYNNVPPEVKEPDILYYFKEARTLGLRTGKGITIDQYTYAVAVFDAPFFFAAHLYEKAKGLPANGFSANYDLAVRLGNGLYAFLGLLVLYKIVRRFYTSGVAVFTVCALFLGSNLFWFAVQQSGMSHIPLFLLYALLVWLTIKVHEVPSLKLFIAMGFVVGFITIMRPTDIICVLIPLLYGVYNKTTVQAKAAFLKAHFSKILLMAVLILLPAIPQMIYWKLVSGHFIYYSYGQQGFNWLHPKMIDGFVGGNNGWLMYSPLMIFALAGMFFYRSIRPWFWCLWVLLPLYCYIIYSWYCYNYINGFGSRPMVHIYPLLALPFAALVQWCTTRGWFIKGALFAACAFLIAVSFSYSTLQARGMLNSEESNFSFNTGLLFKDNLTYNDLAAKDCRLTQPDPRDLQPADTLGYLTFEDSLSDHFIPDPTQLSKRIYQTRDEEIIAQKIRFTYSRDRFKDAEWLKCSGRFMYPDAGGYYKHLMVISITRNGESTDWRACKVENKIGLADSSCAHQNDIQLEHSENNRWGNAFFYVKLPRDIEEGDQIECYIWNTAKSELFMDDLCLQLYRKK